MHRNFKLLILSVEISYLIQSVNGNFLSIRNLATVPLLTELCLQNVVDKFESKYFHKLF